MTFRASPMMWYVWSDWSKGSVPVSNSCSLWPRGLTGGSHWEHWTTFPQFLLTQSFWECLFPHLQTSTETSSNPASLVNCCFQMKLCDFFFLWLLPGELWGILCILYPEIWYHMKWMPSHLLPSLLLNSEFRTCFLFHSTFLLVNYFMFLITW